MSHHRRRDVPEGSQAPTPIEPSRRERAATDALIGFLWTLTATLFIVVGGVIAAVGVGAHLLIRFQSGFSRNITYDPSTVALWAPLPILVGLLLLAAFVAAARKRRWR